jgi:hypothetical protein
MRCFRELRHAGVLSVLCLLMCAPSGPAWSLPSFARSTGLPCSACHTLSFGPALTAYGRTFKLHAYALGTKPTIPLSADLIASFTHTQQDQPAAPKFASNDNLAIDDIDGYFAGRIADHFGALAQVTFDGIARHTSWGLFDVRYARDFTFGSTDTLFGVTLNNFPTVQDPWNSTYAWQFPFPATRLANEPAPFLQIQGAFATQSLGATAYTMIDDLVYLEAGAYRNLSDRLQGDLGIPNPGSEHAIDGTAPYWRVAFQKAFGSHYGSIGAIGFAPRAQSPQERSIGASDNYTDTGVDATYQFNNGSPHTFNAYFSYIHEEQRLFGSTALGASSTIDNHLNALNVSGNYAYQQTYALTVAYFDTTGNVNPTLYAPGPWFGSANGSPDSRGYILQLEYIPFGKIDSIDRPFLNLRVGVQYTGYVRFNGGNSNYDGFGHSAADNNTLFLFLWTAI